MSIEHVWNKTTQHHLNNQSKTTQDNDAFETAYSDASDKFKDAIPFTSKTPNRVDTFPETPKDAIGLQMTDKNMDDTGLIDLLNKQFPNNKYEALFLGKNNIGDMGAQALAKTLQQNSTVKHLILPHNQLSNFAVAALADMLKVNHYIGWLVLNNNDIGDDGASALGQALQTNTGVKHLILADNHIGDNGVIALAKGLETNCHVETLCLQGNPIGTQGINALIQLVRQNNTLKKIDIRDIGPVDEHTLNTFDDIAKKKGLALYR